MNFQLELKLAPGFIVIWISDTPFIESLVKENPKNAIEFVAFVSKTSNLLDCVLMQDQREMRMSRARTSAMYLSSLILRFLSSHYLFAYLSLIRRLFSSVLLHSWIA